MIQFYFKVNIETESRSLAILVLAILGSQWPDSMQEEYYN